MRARRLVSAAFFVAMGLGLPGASLPCAAQVYFPSTITFSGSNVPQQQLLAFTGLKPGRVTKAQMQAASDRLTRSGVFIQANYELDDDALRYTLTLSAALLPVRYDNFPWWDTKTLTALVAAKVPLFGGELYPGGPMRQQVAAALTQLVAEKGVRAKVGTSPVGDAHGKMMATRFHIDAPPVVISSLTINGAGEAFAADIEPIEKAASGHDLAQEAPDALAAAIRAVYTRRGYLDVAMTEPVWGAPVVEDGKIMAPLTVTISSEGEPYTVSAVNFAGDAATTPEAFKAEAKIHVGEVADSDAVAVTGDLLKAPWKAKGYEGVGVDRGEAVNRAQHTVAYTFTVDPGTVYRMGTLTLIGLNKRQAGQVLRYWRMPKGAPFQPSLLAAWRGAYMRSRGDQLIVAEGLEHMVPAYESQADHDMQTVNVVVRFTPPVVVANPLDFHPNWK